jgi:hypothetical protein
MDRVHDRRTSFRYFQMPVLPHRSGISADIPVPMRMDIADLERNSQSISLIDLTVRQFFK